MVTCAAGFFQTFIFPKPMVNGEFIGCGGISEIVLISGGWGFNKEEISQHFHVVMVGNL